MKFYVKRYSFDFLEQPFTECEIGRLFACHIEKGHYWFRFFGKGMSIQKNGKLRFSQRMYLSKWYKIGDWVIIPKLTS
jgi:hypothetical protein